jgi:hypothetical protein
MNKKIVSNILANTKREWIRVDQELPLEGEGVLIRFMDLTQILKETDTEIYPMEDMKMARFYPDGTWVLIGPHPLYDYSPMSNKSDLKENALVTHWSRATDEEWKAWGERLDPQHNYDCLQVVCSPDHQEKLYKALMQSAEVMRLMGENKEIDEKSRNGYMESCKYLYDLLAAMDFEGIGTAPARSED